MRKKFTITLTNPLYRLVKSYRLKKANSKWNKDLYKRRAYIKMCKRELNDACFYWNQLVLQEIGMYISISEQVTEVDFNHLAQRRGFDKYMFNYLRDMLVYVGLGRQIKYINYYLREAERVT